MKGMERVMLGMPGPWARNYREKSDHYTTKIGGAPDWPVEEIGMKSDLFECVLCGRRLCLVAQVYAPIGLQELSFEERVIYILGCPTRKCGSNPRSWRALRVQKRDARLQVESVGNETIPLEEFSTSNSKTSSSWWQEGLLENGLEEDAMDLNELASAFSQASTLASSSKKQNGAAHSGSSKNRLATNATVADGNLPVLPCFYMYSQEDRSSDAISATINNFELLHMEENHHPSSEEAKESWGEEAYEYNKALGADRTYLKFKKHIDAYPEQCFRYSYGGKPLLATTEQGEPKPCTLCGSKRHYEMQLMPPLIYFLHEAADDSAVRVPEEWSWLTLIIFTCSKSCCPSSWERNFCGWTVVEEAVLVQNE